MWQLGDEPIPGYRLESRLGEGSNAVVWRATGPGGTATALKRISLSGKLGLKEFRGIQRVKEIRHAHLLPISAVWLLDDQGDVIDDQAMHRLDDWAHGKQPKVAGTAYVQPRWPKTLVVAMLLADTNLFDLLEQTKSRGNEGIPVDELLDYMEDAAKGIDFLNSPRHDLGSGPVAVQHCDVKPQNIVLVGDSAMVCDFGLARVTGGGEALRTLTGPAGTPAYIAPECIRGTEPSATTDQYSLAITYFELRTGRLPVTGQSVQELFEAHATGRLQLDPLPPAERDVIRRATSLRPEDRFPTASKMVRALRRAAGPRHDTSYAAAGHRQEPLPSEPPPGAPPGSPRGEPSAAKATAIPAAVADDVADEVAEARDTDEVLESGRDSKHDARLLVERGTASLKQGDVQSAISDFDKAIDMAPDMAEAYYGRAMAYGATAEHRRKHAAAFDEQAHSHFAQGDYRHAVADFSEAIRINPELAAVNRCRLLRNRALAYRIYGEFDKALADYDQVVRLHPDFARAYYDRALTYRAKRDYDRAIADHLEAIRLSPDDAAEDYRPGCAAAYRERGDAHYRRGDYGLAVADYDEAIRIRPQWGIIYNQRGRTYAASGEYGKAVEDYGRAIQLDQEFAHLYYYNRGNAHFKNANHDEAVADFTLAVERKPDYAKAYRARSRAYRKLGMEAEAQADETKVESLK